MPKESVVDLVPKALYDLYRAAGAGEDKLPHDEQKQKRARDVAIRFAQKCKARVEKEAGGALNPHAPGTKRALAGDVLNHRGIRRALSMMDDGDWVGVEVAAFAHGISKLSLERALKAHFEPELTEEEKKRGVLPPLAWRVQLINLKHARRKEHRRS
ncbi:hypothetical protein [Luteibacter aegosomatissinici]|uniref:hypothetical protein n=1 Tax=Luteibacter aegosomatissinici TaxID=2911539 RepID=UPI001FFAEAA4|nr:hypothetical protein [Luteibacter aegosomatissinici]UPG92794.1 hypothetical protein L2Y97_13060 [Luteibacter aegosomatissinici]